MLFHRNYVHKHRVSARDMACATCEGEPESICSRALLTNCNKLGCEKTPLLRQRWAPDTLISETVPNLEPRLHVGRMASGDTVIKSGKHRDQIAEQDNVIAFEMEGAGAFSHFPYGLVIKGVCDYADSHKHKLWQRYSAATAAAFTKSLLAGLEPDAKRDEQGKEPRPNLGAQGFPQHRGEESHFYACKRRRS